VARPRPAIANAAGLDRPLANSGEWMNDGQSRPLSFIRTHPDLHRRRIAATTTRRRRRLPENGRGFARERAARRRQFRAERVNFMRRAKHFRLAVRPTRA
jgi:hypothetical protein